MNIRLNQPVLKPSGQRCSTFLGVVMNPFKNRAQNRGITVIATKYDANSEITTASANAENRNLLTP